LYEKSLWMREKVKEENAWRKGKFKDKNGRPIEICYVDNDSVFSKCHLLAATCSRVSNSYIVISRLHHIYT